MMSHTDITGIPKHLDINISILETITVEHFQALLRDYLHACANAGPEAQHRARDSLLDR